MPQKKSAQSKKKPSRVSKILLFLFFLILILLATLSSLSEPQELRNFAEEPSPTLTPTPLLRCNVVCTYNSQCPTGLFCDNGACRNPQCKNETDCICVITPTYPNAPTKKPTAPVTPKPTATPKPTSVPTIKTTLTPTITVTVTKAATLTPSVAYISPQQHATNSSDSIPTQAPVPTISPQGAQKISILEVILDWVATVFCKLLGAC